MNRTEQQDLVERLVRLADAGPDIPPGGVERVRAAIRPAWERQVKARRTRNATLWTAGALAAAAAIAIVLLSPLLRDEAIPASTAPAAWVERILGKLEIDAPGELPPAILQGEVERGIQRGSTLRTGPEDRASIRLVRGASVRMDVGTELTLASSHVLELGGGAVYIDAGEGHPVEVRTPLGTVRDIGTQFEVRADAMELLVKVRTGAVSVQQPGGTELTVGGGTVLSVGASGRRVTSSIAVDSEEWEWTFAVSATPAIEGRSVTEVLEWVASETGVAIHYESEETERFARATILHGSLGSLRPDQAAEAVLPSAGLEVSRERGALIIRRAR